MLKADHDRLNEEQMKLLTYRPTLRTVLQSFIRHGLMFYVCQAARNQIPLDKSWNASLQLAAQVQSFVYKA